MNTTKKGYLICTADNSSFYIPNAEHIERNDELGLVEDDIQASKEAEKDGIKLIYNMEGVPNGVYIDTLENREIIKEMLEKFPEYKKYGYKEKVSNKMRDFLLYTIKDCDTQNLGENGFNSIEEIDKYYEGMELYDLIKVFDEYYGLDVLMQEVLNGEWDNID